MSVPSPTDPLAAAPAGLFYEDAMPTGLDIISTDKVDALREAMLDGAYPTCVKRERNVA